MTTSNILSQLGSPGVSTSFRNRIINGAMVIWQRGTSFSSPSFGSYTVDRFYNPSGATTSISQSTNVPSGFRYSVSVSGNSGGSNGIAQRIESYNCTDLAGQSVTISFWALNSSGADNLQVALYYANSQDTFSGITQIGSTVVVSGSPSSSWTQYSTTFTSLPSGAANGLALLIYRGSSASSTTLFTGVQLEVGTTATNFEVRSIGTELALCQRYLPAFNGSNQFPSQADTTTSAYVSISFPVQTRVAPTGITVNSLSNFSAWKANTTSAGNPTSITFNQAGVNTGVINPSGYGTGGLVAGNYSGFICGASAQILFTGCEL